MECWIFISGACNSGNCLCTYYKRSSFSLILGVLSGTIIYSSMQGEGIFVVFDNMVSLMGDKIADNIYIILFLCLLGILVHQPT